MIATKVLLGFSLLAFFTTSPVKATCVWNSDFGFTLDCAFKKSSLFRVRNLGGIKTHVGLGFTVGDDMMFPESLGNEDSKRRSVSNKDSILASVNGVQQKEQDKSKNTATQKPKKNRLTVRIPSSSTASPTKASTTTAATPTQDVSLKPGRSAASVRQLSLNKMPTQAIPPFKPIPPKETPGTINVLSTNPTISAKHQATQNTQAQRNPSRIGQAPKTNYANVQPGPMRIMGHGQNTMTVGQSIGVTSNTETAQGFSNTFPQFHSMPASTSKVLSQGNDISKPSGSVSIVSPSAYKTVKPTNSYDTNFVAMRKVHEEHSDSFKPMYPTPHTSTGPSQFSYSQIANYVTKPVHNFDSGLSQNVITGYGANSYTPSLPQGTLYEKILAISKATNISVEAIEAAIKLRQQQLISQMMDNSPPSTHPPKTTSTTPSTTHRPIANSKPPKRHTKPQEPAQKVMNAPKEYYPVGYDKNFDDNFETKVDLPETTFYCGDQKHFPGLYGDEDLGCMVFHVCALTDEGLIMKSFLCPESTLFDQTILKCNWWFYVDCKNTKPLYDSNIPVSKSYQLMKALTFFSSYKKETLSKDQNAAGSQIEENKQGVRNAIRILHKQSHMELPKVEVIEAKSNNRSVFSFTDEGSPVDAVEVNSLSTPVDESENNASEKLDRSEKQIRDNKSNKYGSHSSERRRNASRFVPKTVIISPKTSEFQLKTSTEKSIKISTSQERRTRRPIIKSSSAERTTNSSESNASEKEIHRPERASGERIDSDIKKILKPAVHPGVLSVHEKSGRSKVEIVTPVARQSVDDTIAKMDEAIMGSKKLT